MTLAQEFNAILTEETKAYLWHDNAKADELKDKRLAFEEKYSIAIGNAWIGTWESLTLIFVDGSVYVNSDCRGLYGYYTFS